MSERGVARACRVNKWILRRWQRELDEFGAMAFGGYGKNRRGGAVPRTRKVYLSVTTDELDAVKAASWSAGFRSLPKFVRSRRFHATDERPVRSETVIEDLVIAVRKLTKHVEGMRVPGRVARSIAEG